MRVVLSNNPLAPSFDPVSGGQGRPAWISPQEHGEAPEVVAYRLRFALAQTATVRVHVTADERYELWLDGQRIGRGPERGAADAWFYESYDLPLAAGEHVLVARVWHLGELAPLAQVSTAPGFLLMADPPFEQLLSTGSACWEAKRLNGYTFEISSVAAHAAWFVGSNQTIDAAALDWGVESGAGEGWAAAISRREDAAAFVGIMAAHWLRPALLPGQISVVRQAGTVRFAAVGTWNDPQVVFVPSTASDAAAVQAWQAVVDGRAPVVVPPHTRQQVILDFGQYYCAYPQLVTSGGQGSTLTTCWTEALYLDPQGQAKGQRDEVAGRYFIGFTRDIIRPDGGAHRRFETLWWRAGRYLQILVETADEPVTVEAIRLEETRYPLEMESRISTDDDRWNRMVPIALRGLQMCAHETYMDCPYYEQMMYVGDTRLEALTTYAISNDDRLPRKAILLFDHSRLSNGLVQARYPSHDVQIIPPFTLWWVGMLHDFAAWRGDKPFVSGLLPGMRAVVDGFLAMLNDAGVLAAPDGWNFVDWIADWPVGVPPDGLGRTSAGVSGLLNWHLVYTLTLAAQLETWAGEPELAQRFERQRRQLAARLVPLFWDERRGLFADDLARAHFSEHTQCLALLSGMVDGERRERMAQGLLGDPALTRTTIYFNHYLFETYRLLGRADALFDRLGLWFDLPAQGFKTTPEQPEPTRSDCHGWGTHPLYHYFATILGIRPAGFGFEQVEIAPLLGSLQQVSGSLVHPRGRIDVQLQTVDGDGRLNGTISLPDGVTGMLRYGGMICELTSGAQQVKMAI